MEGKMIEKTEVYFVKCDGDECNELLDESGGDYVSTAYDTEDKAKDGARSCGWKVGEGEFLCPECSDKESK
jgi:hypothetical protein